MLSTALPLGFRISTPTPVPARSAALGIRYGGIAGARCGGAVRDVGRRCAGRSSVVGLPAAALKMAMFSLLTSGAVTVFVGRHQGLTDARSLERRGAMLHQQYRAVLQLDVGAALLLGLALCQFGLGGLRHRAAQRDQLFSRIFHMGRHWIARNDLGIAVGGAVVVGRDQRSSLGAVDVQVRRDTAPRRRSHRRAASVRDRSC